ncbi:MAG: hypothetical protein ACI9HE_001447 [Planctomycetota bacterium]|jgi:hypothetical protein
MRLTCLALPVLLLAASCASGPEGGDWIDLDQSSAWRGYKAESVPDAWVFDDGGLHLTGGGAGDLITVERFGAFDFEYEWRISPMGNSGVMFNVQETDGPTYVTGPEMQVFDNAGFKGERGIKTAAGACYALYGTENDDSRAVGEWNQARITIQADGSTEFWLNGAPQCSFQLGSEEWNASVAASKFKSMPAFGLKREGHLALQDHGNPVWFRAMRIRRL